MGVRLGSRRGGDRRARPSRLRRPSSPRRPPPRVIPSRRRAREHEPKSWHEGRARTNSGTSGSGPRTPPIAAGGTPGCRRLRPASAAGHARRTPSSGSSSDWRARDTIDDLARVESLVRWKTTDGRRVRRFGGRYGAPSRGALAAANLRCANDPGRGYTATAAAAATSGVGSSPRLRAGAVPLGTAPSTTTRRRSGNGRLPTTAPRPASPTGAK